MDAPRFDRLTRSLTDTAPRRALLGGVAAALGLAALRFPVSMEAKKKRKSKNKKKPPAFNPFGCLNVGQKCRGNSANCCSGICQGKKPKKGEKDSSECVAHDEGGCLAGQPADVCSVEQTRCTTSNGLEGGCATTTGQAGYCAVFDGAQGCRRDADCRAELGSGAACIVCSPAEGGTLCVGLDNPV